MKAKDVLQSTLGQNLLNKGELPTFVFKLDEETTVDLAVIVLMAVIWMVILNKAI